MACSFVCCCCTTVLLWAVSIHHHHHHSRVFSSPFLRVYVLRGLLSPVSSWFSVYSSEFVRGWGRGTTGITVLFVRLSISLATSVNRTATVKPQPNPHLLFFYASRFVSPTIWIFPSFDHARTASSHGSSIYFTVRVLPSISSVPNPAVRLCLYSPVPVQL